MSTPARVTVFDVGPRDGLQNEPDVLSPDVRAELVDRLVHAGLPAVEVASFVDPRRVPQMAGAEEVVAAIESRDGVVLAGLALNERGYEEHGRGKSVARMRDTLMVNPIEVLPVLLMVFAIALIPLLSDGPPG